VTNTGRNRKKYCQLKVLLIIYSAFILIRLQSKNSSIILKGGHDHSLLRVLLILGLLGKLGKLGNYLKDLAMACLNVVSQIRVASLKYH